MTDLLSQLQNATEGSRELDAAVEVEKRAREAAAAGLSPEQAAQWRHLGDGWVGDYHTKYMSPRYTIDATAALTLVPTSWRVEHIGEQLHLPQMWECELHDRNEERGFQGEGPTPCLAICQAAIKAHKAEAA